MILSLSGQVIHFS